MNAFDNLPELIIPRQLAQLLHIKVNTLKQWRFNKRHPELSYTKIGKYIRYHKESVIAFIQSNTVQPSLQ